MSSILIEENNSVKFIKKYKIRVASIINSVIFVLINKKNICKYMKSRLIDHISPEAFNETYIRTDYSRYAMNQVSQILKHGIDDQAVSRREVEAITIDWATSLDLDDAIWVEKTTDGYCVWIHISDVTEAIPIFSPLDIEALHRTTSIYRKDHILDMFPPELSNGILSLDPYGWKKLTMTLQIDLDDQWVVKSHEYYESRFTSLKRYDYESFWEDFINPESQNHDTLHLFKEVSDKLRANRVQDWWMLNWTDDGRRLQLGWNISRGLNSSATTQLAHNIIESLMVLANGVTGQHVVDAGVPALLKRHDSLDERSFYHHGADSFHAGLWMKNYTHFTSPIRRYVDIIIHRIIKALERWEEIPYVNEDMKFTGKHSNNTRWKVDTLWAQTDLDVKGEEFIVRTEKRLWRPLEVYDMKPYIRNSTNKSLKLPKAMKEAIAQLIQRWDPSFWNWALGIILLWKDNDLKVLMKKRVLEDKIITTNWFLNILTQTQILLWEGTIFELDTHEESWNYSMNILHKSICVAKSEGTMLWYDSIERLRSVCRRELISKLFDYYIDLDSK